MLASDIHCTETAAVSRGTSHITTKKRLSTPLERERERERERETETETETERQRERQRQRQRQRQRDREKTRCKKLQSLINLESHATREQ